MHPTTPSKITTNGFDDPDFDTSAFNDDYSDASDNEDDDDIKYNSSLKYAAQKTMSPTSIEHGQIRGIQSLTEHKTQSTMSGSSADHADDDDDSIEDKRRSATTQEVDGDVDEYGFIIRSPKTGNPSQG